MRVLPFSLAFLLICSSEAQEFHPNIPKAWDDKEVEGFEVPLAQLECVYVVSPDASAACGWKLRHVNLTSMGR